MSIRLDFSPFVDGMRAARGWLKHPYIRVGSLMTYYIAGRWILKWGDNVLAYYIAGRLNLFGKLIIFR